jgi:uncharacterized cupredoxin-like copper-binding protein
METGATISLSIQGEDTMKRTALPYVITAAMILTIACGSSAPIMTPTPSSPRMTASANNSEVDVTLEDNTIKSSQTTFKAGMSYTFVIINAGRHAHNFNIAPPVSVAGSLDAALSSALLTVSRDQLQAGESVSVEYTFPDSVIGLKLEFSCLIPRHYEDGMLLAITVTK